MLYLLIHYVGKENIDKFLCKMADGLAEWSRAGRKKIGRQGSLGRGIPVGMGRKYDDFCITG